MPRPIPHPRLRRPPPRPNPPAQRVSPLLALALALAAFALGRYWPWEAPAPAPEPPAPAEEAPAQLASVTSTAGLCPCPAPRPPRITKKPLARRAVPARAVDPAPRADPSAATARFLRDEAAKLTRCAPPAGAPLRLHVEVEVAPSGEIQATQITNLEPVPGEVSRCVLDALNALGPPGFDAVDPRRFALTVVL
ncbi:MAG: hypothetical protein H6730_05585 [Deltaproteobacteria bacterium]|nr:hypothetical protein [Deltaproteobacteria bacterium]